MEKVEEFLQSSGNRGARARRGIPENQPQSVLNTKIASSVMAAAKEAAQFEGRLLGKFVEVAIREKVERLGRKVKQ